MKNHKMNFTSEQLGSILQACEWAINDDFPMSDPTNALPDESWDYADYGIPSLTLCVPVGGELHGDAGVMLRKESALEYCNVLSMLAGVLC